MFRMLRRLGNVRTPLRKYTDGLAILREPGKSFVDAIADKSHAKPDYSKTLVEFSSYVKALQKMGFTTTVCPPDERFPDGNFVEDTHFVTNKFIIELNPGTPSRKKEYTSLSPYLPSHLPLYIIPKELTIDGGDILCDGNDIYIGISKRTQIQSIKYFEKLVKEYDYQVYPVPVPEGLHLKSGMTCVTHKNFVIQKSFENILIEWQKKDSAIQYFVVPENEKHAANVIVSHDQIIIPDQCPKTREYIRQFYSDENIQEVSTEEVRKVDGALTCCSLLFPKKTDVTFSKEELEIDKGLLRNHP